MVRYVPDTLPKQIHQGPACPPTRDCLANSVKIIANSPSVWILERDLNLNRAQLS